jgi:hypothetical protein
MGFTIVGDTPLKHTRWYRVDTNDTLYVGQLVKSTSDGLAPMGAASGAADTSNKSVPWGIVIGTSDYDPTHSATYGGDYITGVTTQAAIAARKNAHVEGQNPKGDKAAYVHVARIFPDTHIAGPIFNAAYGTAITEFANTVASTDGLGITKAATIGFTPVGDLATIYCRTGANAGVYRITTNTSTTIYTWTHAMGADIAIGDTFVYVPMRDVGPSYVQFDAESTYIEGGTSASLATNYYIINVEYLILDKAGEETCVFTFGMDHFCPARA